MAFRLPDWHKMRGDFVTAREKEGRFCDSSRGDFVTIRGDFVTVENL